MAQWTVLTGWSATLGPTGTLVLVTVRWEEEHNKLCNKPAAGNAAYFCPSPGAVVEEKNVCNYN